MTSLDRILEHRRLLEQRFGRDPGLEVAAADLAAELPPGAAALSRAVSAELTRTHRTRRPFVVLQLEAPGVDAAEDAYGAMFGQAAWQRVQETVGAAVRECDTVVPLAGTIAVVLPETSVAGARALASRLIAAVGSAFAGGFLGREVAPALRPSWRELPVGESA